MSNASLAASLATLRTSPQAFTLGLAVHKPSVVSTSTLASLPTWVTAGTGNGTLTASGAMTGTAGQTVRVSLSGVVKGYLRLRADLSGTSLSVSATSENALNIAAGDTLEVLNEWRAWPKRIRLSGTSWLPDFDIAYTDQNTNHGPQSIMGCAIAKSESGSSSFVYTGSGSVAHSPGASITGYSWTFPDGSTSSSADPTFSTSTAYADGAYTKLTATESTGKTHTGYRLLWKFTPASPPYSDFTVTDLEGAWGGGWRGTVRVRGDATTDDFPAGAHVAIFYSGQWASTTTTIGGNAANRSNMLFEGYIVEGSVKRDTYNGWVEFGVATLDATLEQLYAFPVAYDYKASPANWLQMAGLTLDKTMLHLCKWRSTVLDICDVILPAIAGSTATKPSMDLDAGSLWAQMQQIYSWLPGGVVSVDAQGAIYPEQDCIVSGTVASAVDLYTLAPATDLAGEITITEKPLPLNGEAAQVALYGIQYSATAVGKANPIGSRAPNDPIDYGARAEEVSAGLLFTQAQANAWAGGLRSKINNAYPSAEFPLYGFWPIDPTPQSFITATLTTSEVPRPPSGVTRYIVRGTSHQIDTRRDSILTRVTTEPQPRDAGSGTSIAFTTNAQIKRGARTRPGVVKPPTPTPPTPPLSGADYTFRFISNTMGWTAFAENTGVYRPGSTTAYVASPSNAETGALATYTITVATPQQGYCGWRYSVNGTAPRTLSGQSMTGYFYRTNLTLAGPPNNSVQAFLYVYYTDGTAEGVNDATSSIDTWTILTYNFLPDKYVETIEVSQFANSQSYADVFFDDVSVPVSCLNIT